jgi:hypothetical protein
MQNQVVKGNDIRNVSGNVIFNNFSNPKKFIDTEKVRKSIIELLNHIKYLKQELSFSRKHNTELIRLLGVQTDRIVEKETEIRDLRRKFEKY